MLTDVPAGHQANLGQLLHALCAARGAILFAALWLSAVPALAPAVGGSPPDAQPAASVADSSVTEQVAPGVVYRARHFTRDGSLFAERWLEVDPRHPAVNLLPVHALDKASGKETVSAMARRYGAAAAMNGGYFVVSGPYAGTSQGVYQLNGRVLSSGANRSALVLCAEKNYRERADIGVVNFRGSLRAADGARTVITGMNRPRRARDLVLYSDALGPSTLTGANGVEAIVSAARRVESVSDAAGNSPIPPGGWVLSASGPPAEWLRRHLKAGAAVAIDTRLERMPPFDKSCTAEDIIGAGPRLVHSGRIAVAGERFGHALVRHPRTAFAVTRRGTFLFVTVDGRQPSSAGMTLPELAVELIGMGAVEAMNLDGGGSTTIVTRGEIRNSPSDGRERPVSDALLVFSVPDIDSLAALIDKLGETQIRPSLLARIREVVESARQSRQRLQALVRLVRSAGADEISPAAARLLIEAAASLAQSAKETQRSLSSTLTLETHHGALGGAALGDAETGAQEGRQQAGPQERRRQPAFDIVWISFDDFRPAAPSMFHGGLEQGG